MKNMNRGVYFLVGLAAVLAAGTLLYVVSQPTHPNPVTTQQEIDGVTLLAYTASSGPDHSLPLVPGGYELELEVVDGTACFYIAPAGEEPSHLAMLSGSEIDATVSSSDLIEVSVGELTIAEEQRIPFNPQSGSSMTSREYKSVCDIEGVDSSIVFPIWQ